MKKNVIFWVGIKNELHADKYSNFEYFEYSKATWKHFCKRFDCEFVEFNEPIQKDLHEYRVNWQKAMYVFDILDSKGIEYDQIALVDSTCMYKWDAPNFFNLTERKFVGWRDSDNLNWIYQSIQGYKEFFKYDLDITKYINSGFIIFNETHKSFFNSFKDLYESNKNFFIEAQDTLVKKGTEQTPLNYWLQINNIDIKTDLPIAFKLTHMHRKELFGYNWQLNHNQTPFFIKYGYNWIFNGIPKNERSSFISQVWNLVKDFYDDKFMILNKTRHKADYRKTTTYEFKRDLIKHFKNSESNNKTVLELGCCRGDLSCVLADIFGKVIAVDISEENIIDANQRYGRDNIDFVAADVFNWNGYPDKADVVILDNKRDKESIVAMVKFINQKYNNPTIVFVDYGQVAAPGVREGINECIRIGLFTISEYIGVGPGIVESSVGNLAGIPLIYDQSEGVICNLK